MINSIRDLFTGLIFILGIVGLLTGEYIISSALFAVATLVSSANMNSKNPLH